MNRADRLRAAQTWLSAQPVQSAPQWDDVQLVAAMDIHDAKVVEIVLLRDRSRLLARWPDLRAALDQVTGLRPVKAASEPAARPTLTHTPAAASPTAAIHASTTLPPAWGANASGGVQVAEPVVAESVALEPDTVAPGTTDERLTALTRWRDDAAAGQPVLQGLGDVDLQRIARSMARSVEEIRDLPLRAKQLAIDNAAAISGVLRGLNRGDQPAAPASTAASTPASQPALPNQIPKPAGRFDGQSEDDWLSDARFAAFSWAVPADADAALPLTVSSLDPLGVTISWPPSAGEADGWYAYRVVSSQEYPPTSAPDLFDQIGVTRRHSCVDPRVARAAVRHYSIWINHGPDEATARAAQPHLHAVGHVVSGVLALQVRVEGDRVFGRWDALPGTTRVAVMRLPEAEVALRPGYHASYTYPDTLQVNATGFTDRPGVGGSFIYRVFAIADVAGADVWSAPVNGHASVAENVDAVADLDVDRAVDGSLTVCWTPPSAGRVEIYRLATAPSESLPGTLSSRSALAPHLPTEHLLIQPADVLAGRATMMDVRLPTGWTRAYFVPVTVLDERHLRVGVPDVLILPQPPAALRCVERVRAQIVTFAWPGGVDLVRVLSGPRATGPGSAGATALAELTRQQYDEQGGIHLPNPLPADGCALHVYGVTYHLGKPILSVPVSLDYPGLHRLRYQILRRRAAPSEAPTRGGLFGRSAPAPAVAAPDSIAVQLSASHRLDRIRALLVHHPNRLPLHSHDGTPILDQEVTLTAADSPTLEPGVPAPPGYLRLFVTGVDPARPPVAVLDPPISTLRQP